MIHDLSLGEVQSLALKAARGAGRSHGIAEEAAFAVRWLVERGLDGAGQLAALLLASDGTREGCPLHLGAAWSDAGLLPDGPQGPVFCPTLLVPFLHALCRAGERVCLRTEAGTLRVSAAGEVAGAALPMAQAEVRVTRDLSPPGSAPHTRQTRARVAEDALATLTDFAFRTYAPATEASRARGAGAGLSDND